MKKVSNKNYKPLIDAVIEGWYREKVDKLLERFEKDNITLDYTIKNIQALNKESNKDGSYAFNKIVEKVKAKKYPKDVEEKIIEEFKHAFLAEFYEEKKSLQAKEEEEKLNEHRKKIEKIKPYLDGIEHILDWAYSDFTKEELETIGNTIASIPTDIQKELVEIVDFRYFTNPSNEVVTYALEKGLVSLNWLTPKQRSKEIDMIAAKTGRIYDIKELKLSKEVILTFIENNPEKIVTNIDAKNWNTKNLTIYDLNKKELESYKKGLENLKKKQEEEQIELVKKDYRNIETIANPSQIIRNYAIASFRRKWER